MSELSLKRRRSGAISGSERITGVKNAQADVMLLKKKQHFDVVFKKKEQDIQLEENRLENETKLLNLETKQHDLEYKRRLYPDADLSNEEMTVNSLQKYLVRNANKLCYTDKSLENKVRIKCSTNTVPPIVSEARSTIYKKELVRAVEKNRKHMYQFLDKPVSRQDKRAHRVETIDEIDEFEKALRKEEEKEEKLPNFNGHLMPTKDPKQAAPSPKPRQHLALPKVTDQAKNKKSSTKVSNPTTVRLKVPIKEIEKREIHQKLKQNPVVREAVEAHQKEKSQHDQLKSSQSVTGVLSRMARKKPPTKTEVQKELENVQCQVGAFCERIETLLWDYKEEQFRQGIKFIKNKDLAWNKFMDTMKSRNRATQPDKEAAQEEHLFPPAVSMRARPMTAITTQSAYTEREKEKILMKNLLITKPRLVESAPTRKRGIPHRTEERSFHHSPRAKLQRMLELNKNVLDAVVASQDKEEPGAASLIAATLQAQVSAK